MKTAHNAEHNKEKNRYEYRAKNTLLEIFPSEFDGLKKSEKPDWVDASKSVGVEVVRATDRHFQKEIGHFNNKAAGQKRETLSMKEEYKGRSYTAKDLGLPGGSTIISHSYTIQDMGEILKETVKEKIAHINSGKKKYQELRTLCLYVICETVICYANPEAILEFINFVQQDYKNKFAELFVDDGYVLYRYCFTDGTTAVNKLDPVAQRIFVRTEKEIGELDE